MAPTPRAEKWPRSVFNFITRDIPSLLLAATSPLADAPDPPKPNELPSDRDPAELQAAYNTAARSADGRAAAAVPAAGLLGTIAGVSPHLDGRRVLIAASAATVLAALFAASAQVDANPDEELTVTSIERAAWALRRKAAWTRLSSYLAFALAIAVVVLAITS